MKVIFKEIKIEWEKIVQAGYFLTQLEKIPLRIYIFTGISNDLLKYQNLMVRLLNRWYKFISYANKISWFYKFFCILRVLLSSFCLIMIFTQIIIFNSETILKCRFYRIYVSPSRSFNSTKISLKHLIVFSFFFYMEYALLL